MQTFKEIAENLKRCDMSDENCGKCPYKDMYPNECVKELHTFTRHVLQETYEMAEFYQKRYEKAVTGQ